MYIKEKNLTNRVADGKNALESYFLDNSEINVSIYLKLFAILSKRDSYKFGNFTCRITYGSSHLNILRNLIYDLKVELQMSLKYLLINVEFFKDLFTYNKSLINCRFSKLS